MKKSSINGIVVDDLSISSDLVHSSKLGIKQESTLFRGVFVCRLSVRNECVRLGVFADDDFESECLRMCDDLFQCSVMIFSVTSRRF